MGLDQAIMVPGISGQLAPLTVSGLQLWNDPSRISGLSDNDSLADLGGTPATSYSTAVLADSPACWLRLGESSGTDALDSSGNGIDGTYQNTPTLGQAAILTGDASTSVDFAGQSGSPTNQFCNIPLDASMPSNSAFSVEIWFIAHENSNSIVTKGDARRSAGSDVDIFGDGTDLKVVFRDAASAAILNWAVMPFPDLNVRHHIVFTWDGTTNTDAAKFYLNGNLIGSSEPSSTAVRNTNDWNPAGDGSLTSSEFNGRLQDFAYYGSVLSAARVLAHYRAGVGEASMSIDRSANKHRTDIFGSPTYKASSNFLHSQPMIAVGPSGQNSKLIIQSPTNLDNGQCTWFVVLDSLDLSDGEDSEAWLLSKQAATDGTVVLRLDDGLAEAACRLEGSEATEREATDTGPIEAGPVILMLRYDGAELQLWVNNKEIATTAIAGAIDVDSGGNLVIGSDIATDRPSRALGDVLAYDSALSVADKDTVYDHLRTKYTLSGWNWQAAASGFGGGASWISIFDDTVNSRWVAVYSRNTTPLYYATSTYADPHNWTEQGTIISDAARSGELIYSSVESKYYLIYDANSTGVLHLASGSTLSGSNPLTSSVNNPVFSGTGGGDWEDIVRHPTWINESESVTLIYDGRQDGKNGALGRATCTVSDLETFLSSGTLPFTRDAANNPILDVQGTTWEATDLNSPRLVKVGSTYYLLYGGYNEDHPTDGTGIFLHQVGIATAANTIDWVRDSKNPITLRHDDGRTAFNNRGIYGPGGMVISGALHLYLSGSDSSGGRSISRYAQASLPDIPEESDSGASGARQFTAANTEYFTKGADHADFSTGDIDFTIAGWFYCDTLSGSMDLITKWDEDPNNEYILQYHTGSDRFRFLVSNNGSAVGATEAADQLGSPSTSTWYFIVAWHDASGNTLNIQINEGTADSQAYSNGLTDTTSNFVLGYRHAAGGAAAFNGRMSAVGFWKRTLTAAEKTWLYNSGSGRLYSEIGSGDGSDLATSLSAWWNLDESSGNAIDAHTNSHDLTDTNTVTSAGGPGA